MKTKPSKAERFVRNWVEENGGKSCYKWDCHNALLKKFFGTICTDKHLSPEYNQALDKVFGK